MSQVIKTMSILEYLKDVSVPLEHEVKNPTWQEVQDAIQKMDNNFLPVIALSCYDLSNQPEGFEDENAFNIIGGNGKYALTHRYSEWQYVNENGGDAEVQLWPIDQGYFCKEKNIITDMNLLFQIVKTFFETGSYVELENVK